MYWFRVFFSFELVVSSVLKAQIIICSSRETTVAHGVMWNTDRQMPLFDALNQILITSNVLGGHTFAT